LSPQHSLPLPLSPPVFSPWPVLLSAGPDRGVNASGSGGAPALSLSRRRDVTSHSQQRSVAQRAAAQAVAARKRTKRTSGSGRGRRRPAGAGRRAGAAPAGRHRIKKDERGRAVPVCSSFVKAYRSSHCIVPSRTSTCAAACARVCSAAEMIFTHG